MFTSAASGVVLLSSCMPLSLQMADFCEAIRTGEPPRSTAEVGLEVVRIIEAVDASLEDQGRRVEVVDPVAV